MCGRFTLYEDIATLEHFFDARLHDLYQPSYNIAPSQLVSCLISDGKQRLIAQQCWGLHPSWMKNLSSRIVNARIETVSQKPMFNRLLNAQRCCVIASGYFEWQKTAQGKVPHYIFKQSRQPFAMAALWMATAQENVKECVILTAQANVDLALIHDRMPVTVPLDWMDEWLADEPLDSGYLGRLLAAQTHDFGHYTVSTMVNSPAHNDLHCVQPLGK